LVKKDIMLKEIVENRIFLIRGKKVMIDRDLAELYGIETKQLKRAVKRNINRFPSDFMFELTNDENKLLRCQFGTLKKGQHSKYMPFAFTEQGVAMLSSVINSGRSIEVNILIMRAFVKLREMLSTHKELSKKLDSLEKKYDEQFRIVFDVIRALMTEDEKPKRKIGFKTKDINL